MEVIVTSIVDVRYAVTVLPGAVIVEIAVVVCPLDTVDVSYSVAVALISETTVALNPGPAVVKYCVVVTAH